MISRRTFLTSSLAGVSALIPPLSFAQTTPPVSSSTDWEKIDTLLRKILRENILSFWYPQTLDQKQGGYQLNHDIQGHYLGPADKGLVVQSRCVWFYSHLARMGFSPSDHLEAARVGYEFLRDRMWDKEFGGFYWAVDNSGQNATRPDKHLYGQSFALYALSEYYLASGHYEALVLARKLASLLDYYAYDPPFGGYREWFRRDWMEPPEGENGYMSVPRDLKLMNTHLHLMEAFTAYYQASRDQAARERLLELITIQSNSVVRKQMGACTDRHTRNWLPLTGPEYDRVSYGHDLENIWLLMEACAIAGISNGPLTDLNVTLFHNSLQYGFDEAHGGVYTSGPFHTPADNRGKDWWVQAESLVSSLRMYQVMGEEVYLNCFLKMLDWINTHQVDWQNGEWFSVITAEGEPRGDKANIWKSPYHNGRAMMECLRIIQEIKKKDSKN